MGNRDCVQLSGRRCTLHTKRHGEPKGVSKPCPRCREWRCAKHCRCGRNGSNVGRNAPRIYGAAVVGSGAQSRRTTVVVHSAVRAVGKPAPESTQRFGLDEWWDSVVEAVQKARSIEMGTYMFDDTRLYEVLLGRLRDSSDFSFKLCLDGEAYHGPTPKNQKRRVDSLLRRGAEVFLCKGIGRQGSYHVKEMVVDRRFLFTGSANFTSKSRCNRERCYKITGACVAEALVDLAGERAEGTRLA